MARSDLLTRLADVGEDALGKLAQGPTGDRVVGATRALRDRVDELQRRVRGLDELERRVAELERRLAEVEARPRRTRAAGRRGTESPEGGAPGKTAAAKGAARATKPRTPRASSGSSESTARAGGDSPG